MTLTVRFIGVYDHTEGQPLGYAPVGEGETVGDAWDDVTQQFLGHELTFDDWKPA